MRKRYVSIFICHKKNQKKLKQEFKMISQADFQAQAEAYLSHAEAFRSQLVQTTTPAEVDAIYAEFQARFQAFQAYLQAEAARAEAAKVQAAVSRAVEFAKAAQAKAKAAAKTTPSIFDDFGETKTLTQTELQELPPDMFMRCAQVQAAQVQEEPIFEEVFLSETLSQAECERRKAYLDRHRAEIEAHSKIIEDTNRAYYPNFTLIVPADPKVLSAGEFDFLLDKQYINAQLPKKRKFPEAFKKAQRKKEMKKLMHIIKCNVKKYMDCLDEII